MEDDVILFDRFIKDDEVKYFFGAADLIVQPYRNATQSGVTQIAYHFNKPMIVTNVGGLKEMVPDGECGFVVEPESNSVRDAIDKYYNGDYAAAFAKGIAEQKIRFGWDKMTLKIIELYKKLSAVKF